MKKAADKVIRRAVVAVKTHKKFSPDWHRAMDELRSAVYSNVDASQADAVFNSIARELGFEI